MQVCVLFSPTGCPLYGNQPWSRCKLWSCRTGLWLLAPIVILLVAILLIPVITVLLPVLIGFLVRLVVLELYLCCAQSEDF